MNASMCGEAKLVSRTILPIMVSLSLAGVIAFALNIIVLLLLVFTKSLHSNLRILMGNIIVAMQIRILLVGKWGVRNVWMIAMDYPSCSFVEELHLCKCWTSLSARTVDTIAFAYIALCLERITALVDNGHYENRKHTQIFTGMLVVSTWLVLAVELINCGKKMFFGDIGLDHNMMYTSYCSSINVGSVTLMNLIGISLPSCLLILVCLTLLQTKAKQISKLYLDTTHIVLSSRYQTKEILSVTKSLLPNVYAFLFANVMVTCFQIYISSSRENLTLLQFAFVKELMSACAYPIVFIFFSFITVFRTNEIRNKWFGRKQEAPPLNHNTPSDVAQITVSIWEQHESKRNRRSLFTKRIS